MVAEAVHTYLKLEPPEALIATSEAQVSVPFAPATSLWAMQLRKHLPRFPTLRLTMKSAFWSNAVTYVQNKEIWKYFRGHS